MIWQRTTFLHIIGIIFHTFCYLLDDFASSWSFSSCTSWYVVYAKDISNEDHRKHEIIFFYNSTKAEVDTVSQIVRYYSTVVVTRPADRIATGILRESRLVLRRFVLARTPKRCGVGHSRKCCKFVLGMLHYGKFFRLCDTSSVDT